ncbi:MAG: hypothetical protein ABI859_02900 [Pseudomonadota bacterium]
MRKIERIEQQIAELSQLEFAELREWVLERDWAAWDERVKADAETGKLDKLVVEANADFKAGRSREM